MVKEAQITNNVEGFQFQKNIFLDRTPVVFLYLFIVFYFKTPIVKNGEYEMREEC